MEEAIVVLGCRVPRASEEASRAGHGSAMERRATRGAEIAIAESARLIVASGGRTWDGVVEADAMARVIEARGVDPSSVVRERASMNTRENAAFSCALLARRGVSRVIVVTCAWHLPRALHHFRRAGFDARGVAAEEPRRGIMKRLWLDARERLALRLALAREVGA